MIGVFQIQEDFLPQAIVMARTLISLIGFRDQYTNSHSARVANYVGAIATELGLDHDERETAVSAAWVHDIGKIGIPDHILLKPDKLNEEELAWIKKCPEWGWMTLRHLEGFQQAALFVLHQHERVDGFGYPRGVSGKEIPLGSRIINVADSFDALTTNRPYRTALGQDAAVAELVRCSGEQFDPEVVEAFRASLNNRRGAL